MSTNFRGGTLQPVFDRQRWCRRRRLLDRLAVLRRLDAERLLQLAGLVHLHDDVAAADELAVDEQLRDRRPVGKCRELLPNPRIREDVHRGKGLPKRLQSGDRPCRETTGRLVGVALHEENHWVLVDCALNRVAHRVIAHVLSSLSEAWVWIERAWMRPPISVPNTS